MAMGHDQRQISDRLVETARDATGIGIDRQEPARVQCHGRLSSRLDFRGNRD
jgi:hypothetical protein